MKKSILKRMGMALLLGNMLLIVGCGGTNKEVEKKEESQIEKAKLLINTFTTGDVEKAKSLLNENYIQHNLAYETGAEAFVGAVKFLGEAPTKTTVNTIRAFEDGNKVVLHSVYNFAGSGEQVAFDIFRFDENGKIIEHWDNLIEVKALNPSGHSQIDGTTEIKDVDREQTRELVKNFVYDILHGKDTSKLTTYIDGENYIQHNPDIADGLSGLGAALEALGKQGIFMIYNETHQILAQGDFALAISEGTFGGVPTAYYDLFRVENGKIVEHWDVMETIAPKETWKNTNGKF